MDVTIVSKAIKYENMKEYYHRNEEKEKEYFEKNEQSYEYLNCYKNF